MGRCRTYTFCLLLAQLYIINVATVIAENGVRRHRSDAFYLQVLKDILRYYQSLIVHGLGSELLLDRLGMYEYTISVCFVCLFVLGFNAVATVFQSYNGGQLS